jgi:hypothetical protein
MTPHLPGTAALLDQTPTREPTVTLCLGVTEAPIEREPTCSEMKAAWLKTTEARQWMGVIS